MCYIKHLLQYISNKYNVNAFSVQHPYNTTREYATLAYKCNNKPYLHEIEMKAWLIYSSDYGGSAINSIQNYIQKIYKNKDKIDKNKDKIDKIYSCGFSQGSSIAVLGRNYNKNVKKSFLIAGGCAPAYNSSEAISICYILQNAKLDHKPEEIRIVSSQNDNILGSSIFEKLSTINQAQIISGVGCCGKDYVFEELYIDKYEMKMCTDKETNFYPEYYPTEEPIDKSLTYCLKKNGSGYKIIPFEVLKTHKHENHSHGWHKGSNSKYNDKELGFQDGFSIIPFINKTYLYDSLEWLFN